MSEQSLSDQIVADIKTAMRARDTLRLTTLRMLRSDLLLLSKSQDDAPATDAQVIDLAVKMVSKRKDAAKQFRQAKREDLAEKEDLESTILSHYLPTPLSASELSTLIEAAFDQVKPEGMRDMGKLMGILKPQIAGRADMGAISQQLKDRLS